MSSVSSAFFDHYSSTFFPDPKLGVAESLLQALKDLIKVIKNSENQPDLKERKKQAISILLNLLRDKEELQNIDRIEVYLALCYLLPFCSQKDELSVLLPNANTDGFLAHLTGLSADLPEQQKDLAISLARWQMSEENEEELFIRFSLAMHYFGKAIQIERVHLPPDTTNRLHEIASKLLFEFVYKIVAEEVITQIQLNITKLGSLKGGISSSNGLNNTYQKINTNLDKNTSIHLEKFKILLDQIFKQLDRLQVFCCSHESKNMISSLYRKIDGLLNTSKSLVASLPNEIKKIRTGILFQFASPPLWPTQKYHDGLVAYRTVFNLEEMDAGNPQKVRQFQTKIFNAFKTLFQHFLDDALGFLGPVPCNYDIRAMGSGGREELCPFSDLEFLILIEKDDAESRNYFERMIQILEIQILSLGETARSDVVFTCLETKNSSGFHLDGDKALNSDRIRTPKNMAELQNLQVNDPASHENMALRSISLTTLGQEESPLFNEYQRCLKDSSICILEASRQNRAMLLFEQRLIDYNKHWRQPLNSACVTINLKEQYIQLIHLFLTDMALNYGIEATNTIDIIHALAKEGVFSESNRGLLLEAVTQVYAIRLRMHLYYKEQKDQATFGIGDQSELMLLNIHEQYVLEKVYWLVLRPLYSSVRFMLAHEKTPKELFSKHDFASLVSIETLESSLVSNALPLLKPFVHHLVSHLLTTHASYETYRKFFQKLSQEEKYEPLRAWYLDTIEAAAKEQVKQFASDQALTDQQKKELENCFPEVWEAHLELTSRALPAPSYGQAIQWLETRQILKRLSLIPNASTGLRPFLLRKEKSLKEALEAMTTTTRPSDTVAVKISAPFLLGTRYLKAKVIEQILIMDGKDKGRIKRAYGDLKNGGSAHAVSPAVFGGYALHFKEGPSHPLMDYAIHNLYSRIGGSLTSSGVLVCFEVDGQPYPVWVTETVPGKTLKAWKRNPTPLNPRQFTWLLLGELLTRPGDGGLSNYIVGPQNKLYCIDSEAAFVEPVVCNQVLGIKTAPLIQFYSALFCLLKESTLLNRTVLAQFADLDIGTILLAWIDDLIQKEKAYQSLSPEKDLFLDKEKTRPFLPTILFREGTVSTLYLQFWSLQKFIKNQKDPITVGSLLGEIISIREDFQTKNPVGPLIQQKYSKAIKATFDLEKRLMQIRSQQESLSWQQYVKAALDLEQIPSANAIEVRREFSPEKAKEELLLIVLRNSEHFFIIKKGDKIAIGADFKDIKDDIKRQNSLLIILSEIMSLEKEKINSLTFRNCAVLNSTNLIPFLHLGLEYIEIDHCDSFGQPEIELIQNKCCQLKELHISHCPSLTAFAQWGVFVFTPLCFPLLEKLNIENCDSLKDLKLRSVFLKNLNALNNPKLEYVELFLPYRSKLALKGCHPTLQVDRRTIDDSDLFSIKGMPLQSLNLDGCLNITDVGFAHLRGMPLQSLGLSCCLKITDAGLAHLEEMALQSLDLSFCYEITDAGLAHLKRMPLQSLDLSHCENISDAGLAHLKRMPLQSFDLSNCENIGDAGLAHLKGMPLQSLDLYGCSKITDAGLAHLKGMSLHSLDLSDCWEITDAGLAHLEGMPLQSLNLSGCSNITGAALAYLKGMPLQSLNLDGCINFNPHLSGQIAISRIIG